MPLLVKVPGQKQGAYIDTSVGHVDIVPTVLDALGVPVPEDLPGRSLLDMRNGDGPGDRALLMQHWTGRWGLTVGPWKLERLVDDEWLSRCWGSEEKHMWPGSLPVTHSLLRRKLAWSYLAVGAALDQGGEDGDGGDGQQGEGTFGIPAELTDQLEKLGYIIK